jgi:hypothetical protein
VVRETPRIILPDLVNWPVNLVDSRLATDDVRAQLMSMEIDDERQNDVSENVRVIGTDGKKRNGKLGSLQFRQRVHDRPYPPGADRE